MRGDGRIYRRGKRFWIEYWVRGKQYRESAGDSEPKARAKLKKRLREIHGEKFVGPQQERVLVDQLLNDLISHLKTKGAKSVRSLTYHLTPIQEAFGITRAVDLTTTGVEVYIQERLEEGRAPATVNRETGALKQALNLARRRGVLSPASIPYIPMLREDNARQGFFEKAEVEALISHLPETVDDIVRFAYLTGWRKGEILPLKWDSVDRSAGEIRLATSKSGRGRVLPMAGELLALVERRWAAREYRRTDGTVGLSEYVFHHGGKRYVDIQKSWRKACTKAGVSGRLFHDLRRTAVRNMIRAGVPQTVAMSISGHQTVSMFNRYNISSEEDKRQALLATQAHLETTADAKKVVRLKRRS